MTQPISPGVTFTNRTALFATDRRGRQEQYRKGHVSQAPELFNGKGVTDDPAWETYWKAKNGIRLTGMPAFKETLNDTQIWQVSVLLANADKISPAVKAALATTPAAQPSPLPAAAPQKSESRLGTGFSDGCINQ